jgi:hypothetical protein
MSVQKNLCQFVLYHVGNCVNLCQFGEGFLVMISSCGELIPIIFCLYRTLFTIWKVLEVHTKLRPLFVSNTYLTNYG